MNKITVTIFSNSMLTCFDIKYGLESHFGIDKLRLMEWTDNEASYSKLLTSYRLQENKLHRRNLQIADLKEKVKLVSDRLEHTNINTPIKDFQEERNILKSI